MDRRWDRWLAVVVLLFLALTLIVNDVGRGYEWDEAVYFAEVARGLSPVGFDAHRARGITWLAAPVGVFTADLLVLRWFLALSSAAAFGAAFSLWIRRIGLPALIGAGVLATTWLAVFYAVELSPNLWVALSAVAYCGAVHDGEPRPWVTGALAFAIVSLRPSDGTIIVTAAAAVALVHYRDVRLLLGSFVGGVAAWAAWGTEAMLRFDGVSGRLATAASLVESEPQSVLTEHLRLLDGPLIGPDSAAAISTMGVVWASGLIVLAVIAVLPGASGSNRAAGWVALAPALTLAGFYLAGVGALAPRFLLPTYALLAVPAGIGVVRILESPPARLARAGAVAAAVLVVPVVVWHLSIASAQNDAQTSQRADAAALAQLVDDATTGDDCLVASQYGYPQIQVASGCVGSRLIVDRADETFDRLARLADPEGAEAFALSVAPLGPPPAGWTVDPVTLPSGQEWFVYRYED